eukprot:Rmarinus@m.29784
MFINQASNVFDENPDDAPSSPTVVPVMLNQRKEGDDDQRGYAAHKLQQQRERELAKRRSRILGSSGGLVTRNDEEFSVRPMSARTGLSSGPMSPRPGSSQSCLQQAPDSARFREGESEKIAPILGGSSTSLGGPPTGRTAMLELEKHGIAPVFDPTASVHDVSASPNSRRPQVSDQIRVLNETLDLSDIRRFLTSPCPVDGVVRCQVIRESKSSLNKFPTYKLYLELPDRNRFLLAARKRKKNKTANYKLSLDEEDIARQSGNYFGKVRSNFVGREFVFYDRGENPKKVDQSNAQAMSSVRQELGFALYESNVLGYKGPRVMTVGIPKLNARGERETWRPMSDDQGLITAMKKDGGSRVFVMTNKKPKWNNQLRAFCLNFNGRVLAASVKNFQLVNAHGSEREQEKVLLQFGKTGKDTFTMDYMYPLSAVQSFATVISSFDRKLGCE